MKFIIMKPQARKTGKAKVKQGVRVFLEDGTELTGIEVLQLSGQPEWDYWPLHAIADPLRAPDRMVPTKLVLEFAYPDIEHITEPPPSRWDERDRMVRHLAARLAAVLSVTTVGSYQHIYDAARRILDMEMPRPQSGPLTAAELKV